MIFLECTTDIWQQKPDRGTGFSNRRSLLVAREEDLIKNLNPKITGWRNYYVKDEWKADAGIGLVYYLYFYEVV